MYAVWTFSIIDRGLTLTSVGGILLWRASLAGLRPGTSMVMIGLTYDENKILFKSYRYSYSGQPRVWYDEQVLSESYRGSRKLPNNPHKSPYRDLRTLRENSNKRWGSVQAI